MSDKGKLTDIATLLSGIIKDRDWQKILNRHRVFEFWDKAVGKDIAAHARPKFIRGLVLWVDVSDSVWMQQLHLQKNYLLEAINKRLGEDQLEDIRFQLTSRLKDSVGQAEDQELVVARKPDPKDEAEFEGIISMIEDDEIRESLRKIWLANRSK